ncbi:MAG: FaeA/PapI family transcriptional regulator [Candidatus Thorarchaeota archaeon]
MVRFLSINRLAYLNMIRNVRRGLITRSAIIKLLDSSIWITTAEIAKQVDVTAHTVLYHLRNLERERIVERQPEGKGWRLGPFEQIKLMEFLAPTKKKRKKDM